MTEKWKQTKVKWLKQTIEVIEHKITALRLRASSLEAGKMKYEDELAETLLYQTGNKD